MFDPAARPLVVSDCDEVLLYMVSPFRAWLDEAHGIDFDFSGADFGRAMKRRPGGEQVPPEEIWALLNGFFDAEMHRQTPIAGAVEALETLARHADVVVLTNLLDHRRDARAAQLAGHGLELEVYTNQGGKGAALKRIVERHRPSRVLFIDDLPQHHDSVAQEVPEAIRLHMVGEPLIAAHIACAHAAGHAHARIDAWPEALPWIAEQLGIDLNAPVASAA